MAMHRPAVGTERRRTSQLHRRFLLVVALSISFCLGSNLSHILLLHGVEHEPGDMGAVLGEEALGANSLDVFLRKKLPRDVDSGLRDQMRQILSASTHLINIGFNSKRRPTMNVDSFSGIVGEFCPLNFTAQKENPTKLYTFRNVVKSSHCGKGSKNVIRVDLGRAAGLAREYDAVVLQKNGGDVAAPTVLDLKGVIFHESRCGASLAANSLLALDPTKIRVYSESGPPESAMRICAEGYTQCSVDAAANLMKDVVYMMGRSDDRHEQDLYFILEPEATRTMETFRRAFPATPWIFLYRETIEAMESQIQRPAVSLKPSPMTRALLQKAGYQLDKISTTEMIAIQLASFRWSVLRNLKDEMGFGMAVMYTDNLAADLMDYILPKHFHAAMDDDGIERVLQMAENYVSGRDGIPPRTKRRKRIAREASSSVKDAAKAFLEPPYKKLQKNRYNFKQCRELKASRLRFRCPGIGEDRSEKSGDEEVSIDGGGGWVGPP